MSEGRVIRVPDLPEMSGDSRSSSFRRRNSPYEVQNIQRPVALLDMNQGFSITDQVLFVTDQCFSVAGQVLFVMDQCFSVTDQGWSVTDQCFSVTNQGWSVIDQCFSVTNQGWSVTDQCFSIADQGWSLSKFSQSEVIFLVLSKKSLC